MKQHSRISIIILVITILMLTLSACRAGFDYKVIDIESPVEVPEIVPEPIPEPPPPPPKPPEIVDGQIVKVPEMTLLYIIRDDLYATTIIPGLHTWSILYDDDSVQTIHADALPALDIGEDLYNIDNKNHTTAVEIDFINPPDSLTVRRWRDEHMGNAAEYYYTYETVEISGNIIDLSVRDIGYVYDIKAEWEQGFAHYAFRVMSLPWHAFKPFSLPETDPEAFPRLSFYNQIDENKTLYPISFGMPEDYTDVTGVTTFRGNNFRDNPTWGNVKITERQLEIKYHLRTGGIGGWSGVGWTGQPVIIKWDIKMQQIMDIHPHMHDNDGIVEVIQGAMDGFIYFFELYTGEETRPRIELGDVIKGGVTVDARGYPLLYAGQGEHMREGRFGYYIYSLIDGSELFYIDGREMFSSRRWGAFDGNPLFDTEQDRVVIAGENGVVYSVVLNTDFNPEAGTISIDPIISRYKHTGSRRLGTENSPSGFGQYIFFADNAGIIQCLDLHTLEPIWIFDGGDDTDSTLVLDWEEDNERLVIYTGTEVDIIGQSGDAYVRKLDATTGEELWMREFRCGFNADVNGGVVATPVVGKHDISNLAIFSIARTLDRAGYGMVIAFCKETGEEVWEFAMSSFGWSSPVAVYTEYGESYIIASDANGRMYMLRGTTGQELHRINLGGNVEASPAVFENQLVVGTRGQRIYAIEIK